MVKFIPEIRGAFVEFAADKENPLTTFCKEALNCFLAEGVPSDEIYSGNFFRLVVQNKAGEFSCVEVRLYASIENNSFLLLFDKTEWEIVMQLNSEK